LFTKKTYLKIFSTNRDGKEDSPDGRDNMTRSRIAQKKNVPSDELAKESKH
jgi:hypothetical protein